jgi:hypothetical protein
MNLPFTTEQFLNVFEAYNQAIFPAQLVAYLLGAIAVLLAFSTFAWRNRVIAAVLASFWVWTGIFYHLLYFSSINSAAYLFGPLFILQGLVLIEFGVLKNHLQFHFSVDIKSGLGLLMVGYAMIVYPLLGVMLGRHYRQSPMFGVTPCPLTIFTFGMLLSSSRKIFWQLFIIPILWAAIGTTAAFLLNVKEDLGLLVAGVLSVGCLSVSNRKDRAYA